MLKGNLHGGDRMEARPLEGDRSQTAALRMGLVQMKESLKRVPFSHVRAH